jgi:hypothetical protein
VLQHVVDGWALLRLRLEHLADEVGALVADGDALREKISVGTDAAVCGPHIRCLKGRLAYEEGVQNDAQAPHIHLVRVTLKKGKHAAINNHRAPSSLVP